MCAIHLHLTCACAYIPFANTPYAPHQSSRLPLSAPTCATHDTQQTRQPPLHKSTYVFTSHHHDDRPVGRTVRTSNRRKWTIPSGNRGTFVSAYYPVHIRTQLHTFPRTGSPETRSRRPVFHLNTPFICTRPPLNMSHFAGACARYPNRARNNYSHITYIPYYNINGAHFWLTSAVAVELHVYVVVRR